MELTTNQLSRLIIVTIIIAIIIYFLGFFTCRMTQKTETLVKTEYIKGDTIKDTIVEFECKEIKIYPDTNNLITCLYESGRLFELLPILSKKDTIIRDTSNLIVQDWGILREYSDTLINNDTIGTLIVNNKIQYNRLEGLNYEFCPIQKVTTNEIISKRKFTPFVSAGLVTTPAVAAQAGLFIDDLGFSCQYQYNWEFKSHNVGLFVMYKF